MFSTLKPSNLEANPTTRKHLRAFAPTVLEILRSYDLFTPAATTKSDFVDIWEMDQAKDVESGSMTGRVGLVYGLYNVESPGCPDLVKGGITGNSTRRQQEYRLDPKYPDYNNTHQMLAHIWFEGFHSKSTRS